MMGLIVAIIAAGLALLCARAYDGRPQLYPPLSIIGLFACATVMIVDFMVAHGPWGLAVAVVTIPALLASFLMVQHKNPQYWRVGRDTTSQG